MYVNECARCGQSTLSALHLVDCPPSFEERHGRPKPTVPIFDKDYWECSLGHPKVASVYKSRGIHGWVVANPGKHGLTEKYFPTHAEAIAHADRVTREVGNG